MATTWIGRCGCVLLLAGVATVSAQDRIVGPLPSLAPLVEEIAPAVVNISIEGTVQRQLNLFPDAPSNPFPFGPELFGIDPNIERPFQAAGSGVIVDAAQGYLLTNNHVIENADEITVTLVDNRTLTATVVGSDAASDLAVLKVDSPNLTEIRFSTSDDLRVGDYVVAIGNPLGLTNTVTAGIVSALGRGLSRDQSVYEDFIQTDASINVGNSGGALVNLRGELVGINSAIISQTGGNIGIGLAIPVEMARSVMDQLIQFGSVQHGLLGVRMQTVTPDVAEELALPVAEGALVTEVVADSAAEASGIRVNDIIVGVDGESMATGNALRNRIGFKRPGDEVHIDVVRDGQAMTFTAVLGALPADRESPPEATVPEPDPLFEGVELVEDQRFGQRGLVVASLDEQSPAALQGLLQGDLIVSVNNRRVVTEADARTIVEQSRMVFVEVLRDNRSQILRLR